MKALVVYYSKSGTTRRVAEEIARALGADLEEIVEVGTQRSGLVGYLRAGRDAMRERASQIRPATKRPADYDVVFVGSPVWGWNLAPAVRSYLAAANLEGKPVALFCTMASSGDRRTFSAMRSLARGSESLGELAVAASELKSPDTLAQRVAVWAREMAAGARR
ncbi:MAG: flavodoxin [Candidatus Bipolaricaulota bacterium]